MANDVGHRRVERIERSSRTVPRFLTYAVRPTILYRLMKLNAKTRSTFILLVVVTMIIGTFAWEIVERLVGLITGTEIHLAVGPIGFDLRVLSVHIMVNPGTVIGVFPGIRIFRTA
ncbi:MAG: hypothetical protein EA426_10650 [Spirochaetaceae bacterium]|nr:MAG: hypothetical protein EA426_10650 [Spirochaetaceae bacterium]